MMMGKWKTIGISIDKDLNIGGKEFLQTTIDAFKLMIKDATPETRAKVKALPKFKEWSGLVK